MPIEIALYARVSINRQHQNQTQSVDQQIERLMAHVAKQTQIPAKHSEWHLAQEHIYRDDGYSGARLNRPGLDRLREQAAMAAFQIVLITTPDRLARNYVHQVLLLDELKSKGCQVIFLEHPMSDDPHDQLLLQVRGAVAEYERTLITDRMRRGRQAKLRSGQLLPWTRQPYGYLLDPDHPRNPQGVRVDPVKAEVVRQIFAWYTDLSTPASLYKVSQRLSALQIPTPGGGSLWKGATVRLILNNPTYTGTVYVGRKHEIPSRRRKSALQPAGAANHRTQLPVPPNEWIALPAIPVPALVSEEIFALAQARLEGNKRMASRNNTKYQYLLRGLVSCGQCKMACCARTSFAKYNYYLCSLRGNPLRSRPGAKPEERCKARFARADELDEVVWRDVCEVLADPALIGAELERAQAGEWLPQAIQARRKTLHEAVAHLERQEAALLDVYLAEVIGREEFVRKRAELEQMSNGLKQELRELEAQAQQQLNVAKLAEGTKAFCERIQPTLQHLNFDQRRQLVELIIDRVVIIDGQVEIRYVIPTSPKGEQVPFCYLHKDYRAGSPRCEAAVLPDARVR